MDSHLNVMKESLEIARVLYKPTPKAEGLVLRLCGLFDTPLPNGVSITSLSFKEGSLIIGGLSVKELVRCDNHCCIEVHWYPNLSVSTEDDPFCSVFALRYKSLEKLCREVEKVFVALQAK